MNWIAELLVLYLDFSLTVNPSIPKDSLLVVHDYTTDLPVISSTC